MANLIDADRRAVWASFMSRLSGERDPLPLGGCVVAQAPYHDAHFIAGAGVTLLVQMLVGASVAVCVGRYVRREA